MISQLERAGGFSHGDTTETKLDKLDALLSLSYTPPEDRSLLAELLSLPNNARYPKLDLTSQQRREHTFRALASQIGSLAEQRPVLMIFEDVHWIDPTSLEALSRGIDRIKSVGVLLIITHRSEFEPPWIGRPYVSTLSLNRLGERETGAMIDRVSGNKALPENIRQDIIERTDGVPLFVEEMTKAVLEADSGHQAHQNASTIQSSVIAIPASLHASLMTRLDRLGPAKEVAQIGAAMGREFPYALLEAVVRKSEGELQSALNRLVTAGLLFRQGVPPHATYLFKHALVQDAAYGTLLREPRRALHARIAEVLENLFADTVERQPELLARHCTEAGLIEKAARLWGNAGQKSVERSALVEAVDQLARALDQIGTLPGSPALRREQINLHVALITPLLHVKGYAAPETKTAVERARLLIEQAEALGDPPDDPLLLFTVLYGLWTANCLAFNGDALRALGAEFLALAERQGATVPLMIGHRLLATALAWTGSLSEGRAHYDKASTLYNPTRHRPLAMRFGQDHRITVMSFRLDVLWALGYPDAALTEAERVLTDAREIGQAATLMFALSHTILNHTHCGNYVAASAQADELVATADQKVSPFWKAYGMLGRGWVFALTGKPSDAVQMITAGVAKLRSTGSTFSAPAYLSYLARAQADLGQLDDAWRSVGEALTAVETTKETFQESEINRMAGEIALLSPRHNAANAETYFQRALLVARQQEAKSWELRASMSLARLWRDQCKAQQARELLAPVYGWFTQGFETRDLREAKALLDDLAS
jgi:predicted ATPase